MAKKRLSARTQCDGSSARSSLQTGLDSSVARDVRTLLGSGSSNGVARSETPISRPQSVPKAPVSRPSSCPPVKFSRSGTVPQPKPARKTPVSWSSSCAPRQESARQSLPNEAMPAEPLARRDPARKCPICGVQRSADPRESCYESCCGQIICVKCAAKIDDGVFLHTCLDACLYTCPCKYLSISVQAPIRIG